MSLKGFFVFLVLLSLLCLFPVSSQALKSAEVEFTRAITTETSKDTVKGTIFYQAPKRLVLKITQPLTQWMVLEDKTMLIYYPAERKAFRFKSANPFYLPLFQTFIGVTKGELGLEEMGFRLTQNEVRDNVLITHWMPPEEMKRVLGGIVIGLKGERLSFVEVHDAKGQILTKTMYRDHLQYKGVIFPMKITSIRFEGEDKRVTEEISFFNPQFDVELPEDVKNFKTPVDVEIKEVRW